MNASTPRFAIEGFEIVPCVTPEALMLIDQAIAHDIEFCALNSLTLQSQPGL
jgi:hypothetical protein